MEVYRWISDKGEHCEYRFKEGKFIGFFVDDKKRDINIEEGARLTPHFERNLGVCGFVKV